MDPVRLSSVADAEAAVTAGVIIPSLQAVQAIKRSVDDFSPAPGQPVSLVKQADDALILLSHLYEVHETLGASSSLSCRAVCSHDIRAYGFWGLCLVVCYSMHLLIMFHMRAQLALVQLESEGWTPHSPGTHAGSMVYKHGPTGRLAETPYGPERSWQSRLLLSLPLLFTPAVSERRKSNAAASRRQRSKARGLAAGAAGEILWAVRVVHHRAGAAADRSDEISVVDVITTDEEGDVSVIRQLICGVYKGLEDTDVRTAVCLSDKRTPDTRNLEF